MEALKQYIYSLMVISVVGGVVTALTPSGKSEINKYVRFAVSVAAVFAMLAPFIGKTFSELDLDAWQIASGETQQTADSVLPEKVLEEAKKRAEQNIQLVLQTKFSISEDGAGVFLILDTEDMQAVKIVRVEVSLYDARHNISRDKIKEYLEETLYCECEVHTASYLPV